MPDADSLDDDRTDVTEPGDPPLPADRTDQDNIVEFDLSHTYTDTSTSLADPFGRLGTPLTSEQDVMYDMPDPFVRCGCGNCPEHVDTPGGIEVDLSAIDRGVKYLDADPREQCDEPRAAVVREAEQGYRQLAGGRYASDKPSRTDRALGTYDRLHTADRALQEWYDGLTTVQLVLRLSPLDEYGDYRPPLKLADELHTGWRHARKGLNYRLRETFEAAQYVALTTGTDHYATPHRHLYVWIEDPDDEVDPRRDFRPVLARYINHCPSASWDDHPIDQDADDTAITVQYDPDTVTCWSSVKQALDEDDPQEGVSVTQGLKYIASQLVHLAPRGQETPQEHQAGAIAWASKREWGPDTGFMSNLPD